MSRNELEKTAEATAKMDGLDGLVGLKDDRLFPARSYR